MISASVMKDLRSILSMLFQVFVRGLLLLLFVKLPLNEARLTFAICDANLEGSTDSNNILMKDYLPYVQKDYLAYRHFDRRGLLLHVTCPVKTLGILIFVFNWLLVLYFFFLCRSPSCSLFIFFVAVPSGILKILSINVHNKLFVFGDFNVHSKDCLTNFSRTDRTYLKRSLDTDCHIPIAAFLALLLSS